MTPGEAIKVKRVSRLASKEGSTELLATSGGEVLYDGPVSVLIWLLRVVPETLRDVTRGRLNTLGGMRVFRSAPLDTVSLATWTAGGFGASELSCERDTAPDSSSIRFSSCCKYSGSIFFAVAGYVQSSSLACRQDPHGLLPSHFAFRCRQAAEGLYHSQSTGSTSVAIRNAHCKLSQSSVFWVDHPRASSCAFVHLAKRPMSKASPSRRQGDLKRYVGCGTPGLNGILL